MGWDFYQYQSQPEEFVEQIIRYYSLDISARSVRQQMEERRQELLQKRV